MSLAANAGHDIVGFVDNGMKGGEVASVIDALSQTIRAAGKTPKIYKDTRDLALECRTDDKGTTPCYGAAVFFSSPTEGTNYSSQGNWNYTIRGSDGGSADVRSSDSTPERDMLPFQMALDTEIISRFKSGNQTQLPVDVQVIAYTDQDMDALADSRTANYLGLAVSIFGPLFAFTLVEIVYHMTSFVSHERELGRLSDPKL
ncbi:hypothetical protein G6514_006787 [Epicoccum nigrum]|nr:hypothetical protein G6514_006787 [Epicoccum nigrum]